MPASGGGGPASILTGVIAGPGGAPQGQYITPNDLATTLAAHDYSKPEAERATFKVKIISCFSGRFQDVLSQASNVQFYELSSAADETSSFHRPGAKVNGQWVRNTTDNPKDVTEFMNRNLHGLQQWATSQAAHDNPDLATGLRDAFFDGAPYDFTAAQGLTHPISDYTPGAVSATFPPVLKPIHAVFYPAPPGQSCSPYYFECLTAYYEDATGPALKYTWTVDMSADPDQTPDPGCVAGFQPNKPKPYDAIWYHADASEGGQCNHAGNLYDASGDGHPGIVIVTVSNPFWTCQATFDGTQGPQAQPSSDGPAPQPCKHL
jgi:hypothetical protein